MECVRGNLMKYTSTEALHVISLNISNFSILRCLYICFFCLSFLLCKGTIPFLKPKVECRTWLLLPAGLLAQVVLPHKGMWVQEGRLFLRHILADENDYFKKVFNKTAQIRKYSKKTVPPGVTITQSTASFCIQLEKKNVLYKQMSTVY